MKNNQLYNLTQAQKRILYKERCYTKTNVNHIAGSFSLSCPDIQIDLLKDAINKVIEKHDGLRLRLVNDKNIVQQYVQKYEQREIDVFVFLDNDDHPEIFNKWLVKEKKRIFDLFNNDLFYFSIIKINKSTKVYWKIHHIIADGFTFCLVSWLIKAYYIQLKKNGKIKDTVYPSYIEYISMEKEYLASNKYNIDKSFWLNEFNNVIEHLKPEKSSCNNPLSNVFSQTLPADITDKINDIVSPNYLYQFFLSVIFISLSKIYERKDIVLGVIDRGRYGLAGNTMAGMFAFTMLFKMTVNSDLQFTDFLSEVIKKKRTLNKHKKYSSNLIKDDLEKKGITLNNIPEIFISFGEVGFSNKNIDMELTVNMQFNETVANPVVIHIVNESDGGLTLYFIYQKNYFSSKEIKTFYSNILNLISVIHSYPDKEIKELLSSDQQIEFDIEKSNMSNIQLYLGDPKRRFIKTFK